MATNPTDTAIGASPGRILIVDDEPFNVDYLEQELEGCGYLTESATNGLEALERVAVSPPDLVLLDVMMPELDGIATLRILKQDPDTRLIPVVLMTALNAVEDRVRGIEAGADDFLSKPVDDRELLARIRTAIQAKRVIDQTVGELRVTSEHLDRFGTQVRDVAVLAVSWHPIERAVPDDAVTVIARRRRVAAEDRVGGLSGLVSETTNDSAMLIAAFDGPDVRSRSLAAINAAFAVLGADANVTGDSPPLSVCAAIAVGPAVVGSTRTGHGSELRWAWTVGGQPVERASMLSTATSGAVIVSSEVAAALSDRLELRPLDDEAYFVKGVRDDATGPSSAGRLTTILVTDIVGSTRTFEQMGDRNGGKLLASHERVTRSELVLHEGREINAVGDGFLIGFDSPAQAIRCAFALVDRLAQLKLVIRAGVHTGELEMIDGTARGIAMHVAARIAARAAPGEVLVSSTTRELAEAADLRFADRGEHRLQGLSEPRRLYAATRQLPVTATNPSVSDSSHGDLYPGPDEPRTRRAQARRRRAL
jgi:CheY-like chemotaxis protein